MPGGLLLESDLLPCQWMWLQKAGQNPGGGCPQRGQNNWAINAVSVQPGSQTKGEASGAGLSPPFPVPGSEERSASILPRSVA